jgi:Domain of unknown function (DUF5060)
MTPSFIATALFTFLTSQASTLPATIAVTTPVWSTYDMTLTATEQYPSPYVSVDLLGVFSGPDGRAILVKGFWDGGQTFRIRFTPTIEGTWTFMTVSDDPGLDGHSGILTCVKATDGSHGFVRHIARTPGPWTYDDGASVRGDGATIVVRASTERCGSDGDPCRAAIGPGRDNVDLTRLQAADACVAEALTTGRPAEIALFDPSDATTMDGAREYRYVEYMVARYGASTNVVWCLHPGAADDQSRAFWTTARSLVRALDPYSQGEGRVRVLRDTCSAM